MFAAQRGERGIQIGVRRRPDVADPQFRALAARLPPQICQDRFILLQNRAHAGERSLAQRGRLYAAGKTLQQRPSEFGFKHLHPPRERWLGDVQPGGSTVQAAFLQNHGKRAEQFDHGRQGIQKTHNGKNILALPGRRQPVHDDRVPGTIPGNT